MSEVISINSTKDVLMVVVVLNEHRGVVDESIYLSRGLVGELGHSLGTLRHGVLGELTGEDEADSGLNLAG